MFTDLIILINKFENKKCKKYNIKEIMNNIENYCNINDSILNNIIFDFSKTKNE